MLHGGHVIVDKNPKYVFRGTTVGYAGNTGSQIVPYTCTTANPYKAALFATYCRNHFQEPVVYIAEIANLMKHGIHREGEFAIAEEEIAWKVAPLRFYPDTHGYITIDQMQYILRAIDISIPSSVTQPYISEKCASIGPMDVDEIECIVVEMLKMIIKP